jgi:hypothetical protein
MDRRSDAAAVPLPVCAVDLPVIAQLIGVTLVADQHRSLFLPVSASPFANRNRFALTS